MMKDSLDDGMQQQEEEKKKKNKKKKRVHRGLTLAPTLFVKILSMLEFLG